MQNPFRTLLGNVLEETVAENTRRGKAQIEERISPGAPVGKPPV